MNLKSKVGSVIDNLVDCSCADLDDYVEIQFSKTEQIIESFEMHHDNYEVNNISDTSFEQMLRGI